MSIAVETLPGATVADVSRFCAGLPEPEGVGHRLQRHLRSGGVRPGGGFVEREQYQTFHYVRGRTPG